MNAIKKALLSYAMLALASFTAHGSNLLETSPLSMLITAKAKKPLASYAQILKNAQKTQPATLQQEHIDQRVWFYSIYYGINPEEISAMKEKAGLWMEREQELLIKTDDEFCIAATKLKNPNSQINVTILREMLDIEARRSKVKGDLTSRLRDMAHFEVLLERGETFNKND